MRKLGLDLGTKSLGIAMSDPLNITSQGRENFRFPLQQFSAAIAKIATYLQTYEIDVLVLGYPLRMTGTKSERTLMVEDFAKMLTANFALPVVFVDERLSTKKAEAILIQAKMSRKKRKGLKDQIAAQIILEDYLATIN